MIPLSTYTEQQYTHSNIIQQTSEDLDRAGSHSASGSPHYVSSKMYRIAKLLTGAKSDGSD